MVLLAPKLNQTIKLAAVTLALSACTTAQSGSAETTAVRATVQEDPVDVASIIQGGLTISEFVWVVQARNVSIQTALKDIEASEARVLQADAAFDPKAFASLDLQNSSDQLSRDDQIIYGLDTYPTKRQSVETGISSLFRDGSDIRLSLKSNREKLGDATGYEYDGFVGFTFTKPLMRGAGAVSALATVRAAEIDQSIAELGLQDRKSALGAQAAILFMDGLLAQNDLDLVVQRIDVLTDLMARSDDLIAQGRLPQSAKFEIENAIDQLRARKAERQLEFDRFRGDLLTLMGESARKIGAFDFVQDQMQLEAGAACKIDHCIKVALSQRMDLAAQRLREDKQEIVLRKAENTARPRVDFFAEVGVMHRGDTLRSSFSLRAMQDHPSARFGLEVEIPLSGNRFGEALTAEAQSLLEAEKLRTGDMKLQIENEIVLRYDAITATANQYKTASIIAARSAKSSKMQKDRFEQGRADIMEVLQAQETQLDTEGRAFEARISHLKALIMLRAAQGILGNIQPGENLFRSL